MSGDTTLALSLHEIAWQHWRSSGHLGNLGLLIWDYGRDLAESGRLAEARTAADLVGGAVAESHVWAQVAWRAVMARTSAAEDPALAERLLREAEAMASSTDFLVLRADVMLDLARVVLQHDPVEAHRLAGEAADLYGLKEHRVGAHHAVAFSRNLA